MLSLFAVALIGPLGRGIPDIERTSPLRTVATLPWTASEEPRGIPGRPAENQLLELDGEGPPEILVLTHDGSPATGVPVDLFDAEWSLSASGRTDRRGVVRFSERSPTRTEVAWRAVIGDGHRWPRTTRVVRRPGLGSPGHENVRLPAAIRLIVYVTVGGEAAAGVEVEAGAGPPIVRGADPSGTVEFSVVPGPCRLLVTRFGVVVGRREVVATSDPSEVRIEVAPLVRVRGRVVDPDGRAVPRAPLTVESGDASARLLTGADGDFFAPPLPQGRFRVSSFVPGVGSAEVSAVIEHSEPDPLVVALTHGARLQISPLDGNGRSLPAAQISVVDRPTGARLPLPLVGSGGSSIEDARAGTLLRLEVPGFATEEVVLREADVSRGTLHVTFNRALDVRGRVVRADGTLVLGYEVSLEQERSSGEPNWVLSASSDGSFRVTGAPAGDSVIAVRADDAVHRFRVSLLTDGEIGDLVLR